MNRRVFIARVSLFGALAATGSVSAEPVPFERNVEAGVYGGALFLSKNHELFKDHHEAFKSPVPELGARFALLPFEFVGVEAELGAGPAKTETGVAGGVWAVRAHLIGQMPGKLSPFAIFGLGRLGAMSNVTGADNDDAFHFGLGARYWLDDFLAVRLDLRDTIAPKHGGGSANAQAHSPEVLVGLGFALDTPAAKAPPPDQDGDGVLDEKDECKDAAGPAPKGCPPPPDGDGDGIPDEYDGCPHAAGPKPTGCVDKDPDGDCVPAPADKCPNQPGVAPDGCPDPDPDRDGVVGALDNCPKEPETKNDFQDADGCPDAMPDRVKQFSGVAAGIEFEPAKATLRASSHPTLNEIVALFGEFPTLYLTVSGHTDDTGDKQKNIDLSKARADAVKDYLVSKGIGPERIETRGAGPNEPIGDNKTYAGRLQNQRIELSLKAP